MFRLSNIFLILAIYFTTHAQNSITFRVNLNEAISKDILQPLSGDSVVVRGSFEGWNNDLCRLNDQDRDSVYSGIFDISGKTDSVIEFKYVIVKSTGEIIWETNPDPDNPPYGNRKITLTGNPQLLPVENFHLTESSIQNLNFSRIYSVKELRDDFMQLRKALEADHCNLYEYTGKKEFDSLFDRQYLLIDHPMQHDEFFRLLAPINDKIGCMHSNVWMAGSFWNTGRNNLFPLQVKLIEGYTVVSGFYNDTAQVPAGSIILEINSQPVNKILEDLSSSYSSDGLNKQFQLAQVEKRFPMAYARYYGFPEKYLVKYSLPGRKTSETKELIPAEINRVRKTVFKNFKYPAPTLRFVEDKNTAIITIPSFIFYDRVEYFTNFLDSSFNEIKISNIKNLILDLRGNDGGDPFCAVPLFSYLEKEPVKYFAEEYGRYSEFAKPIPMAQNNFEGNLFTIIDKHCGSTNGHFCALLKYNRIGKLVGEEAGSTYKCNARSDEFNLANTKMIINIARATFSAAVKGMDKTKGVEPDYYVEQTYKDYVNGTDTVLEYTLDLISEMEE
jgi:hypothetical protein